MLVYDPLEVLENQNDLAKVISQSQSKEKITYLQATHHLTKPQLNLKQCLWLFQQKSLQEDLEVIWVYHDVSTHSSKTKTFSVSLAFLKNVVQYACHTHLTKMYGNKVSQALKRTEISFLFEKINNIKKFNIIPTLLIF